MAAGREAVLAAAGDRSTVAAPEGATRDRALLGPADAVGTVPADGTRGRTAATVVAAAALLLAPLVAGALTTGSPAALLAVPGESLAVVLLLVALARRPARRAAAGVFGGLVVAAMLVAALDLGFQATVDRPFNLAEDAGAVVSAVGVVEDATGTAGTVAVVVLVVVLLAAVAVGLARAALRIGAVVARSGRRGRLALAAATVAWIICALAGASLVPGSPVAASSTADALVVTTERAVSSIRDQRDFDRAVAADRFDDVAPGELLTALAGKDVIVAFVESYGEVALERSAFTRGIADALRDGDALLERRGYSAQSALLSSPTFGGVSWLAHATLQSGVWVDSQPEYDRLMAGDRLTLSRAFGEAGWRTVAVVPSNKRDWDEGSTFYGFDAVLDSRNMGYRGPAFGYARMPDQYTWKAFHERELAGDHAPVMAEIDLVSSHTPWTPLPRMVPWPEIGDGSVFASQPDEGVSPVVAWADPQLVRDLYGDSVEYALRTLFSFLDTHGTDDLVLVVLGDHQPARIVSGAAADDDVPVTIIAKDPALFDRIASWGWEPGVRPSSDAPVWRMDEFRDRFLDAFSR